MMAWLRNSERAVFNKPGQEKYVIFFLAFVMLYLTFSSALFIPYAHHDQTRYFFQEFAKPKFDSKYNIPHYYWYMAHGRPIVAEIEAFVSMHTNSLSDLAMFRFAVLVLLALNVALLCGILIRTGLERWTAFALSTAVFLLPGAQNAVFMIAISNAVTSILALLSYACLTDTASGVHRGIRVVLAFVSLLASMFAYAAWSFMFLIPTAAMFLFTDISWKEKRKTVLWHVAFMAAAALCYYLLVKSCLFIPEPEGRGVSYAFELSFSSLFTRLAGFTTDIIPLLFNLWNIYTVAWVGYVLFLFFLAGLIVASFREDKKIRIAVEKVLIFLILLGAMNAVWILSRTDLILFRFLQAGSALAVLCVAWAGSFWFRRHAFKFAVLLMLTAFGLANYTTIKNVWNSNLELMFVRNTIAGYGDQPFERIHVVKPVFNRTGFNGLPSLGDDFNCKTSEFLEVPELVRVALMGLSTMKHPYILPCYGGQEWCVQKVPKDMVIVTYSQPNEAIYRTPGMLLIDMNALSESTRTLK